MEKSYYYIYMGRHSIHRWMDICMNFDLYPSLFVNKEYICVCVITHIFDKQKLSECMKKRRFLLIIIITIIINFIPHFK
jgi:hypothetical protein